MAAAARKRAWDKEHCENPEVKKRKVQASMARSKRLETEDKDTIGGRTRQIRHLVRETFRRLGLVKRSKTFDLLCATPQQVNQTLGPKPHSGAHIDHVCPLSQAKNEAEMLRLWHYSNLQWLTQADNLSKGDKKTPRGEELCKSLLGREWID
jgi:5-methylcytosine-specific restriction endonuclease McrA